MLLTQASWAENFAHRFAINFLQNDRYMTLVSGLQNTLLVSLLAVLLGTVLGTALALMRMSNLRVGRIYPLRSIAFAYIDVVRGTPLVVQLMILYFVVFAGSWLVKDHKVIVVSIAFGLNSAAYVAEIMRAGIQSIDRGQTEAGRSLGLSRGATMRLIILPQAVKNILPALGNEFIVLVKETSIMGYVGMLDLTKAGDNIRSRTFDAFMPLIAVAIIYYLIIKILTTLLRMAERRLMQSDHHE